ncbi:MAG: MarR family winged helix-turn-helix transcriptional regulator [Candidatus Limnocylindrales bacterium]
MVLVLDQLERIATGMVAATNTALAGEIGTGDLSFAQWRLVIILGGAPGPLRLNEIASRVNASMPSTSRLVQRMERRGLVASSPDPLDGRGRRVALTDMGEVVRAQVIGRRRKLIQESLAALDADESTVSVLTEIADRLAPLL